MTAIEQQAHQTKNPRPSGWGARLTAIAAVAFVTHCTNAVHTPATVYPDLRSALDSSDAPAAIHRIVRNAKLQVWPYSSNFYFIQDELSRTGYEAIHSKNIAAFDAIMSEYMPFASKNRDAFYNKPKIPRSFMEEAILIEDFAMLDYIDRKYGQFLEQEDRQKLLNFAARKDKKFAEFFMNQGAEPTEDNLLTAISSGQLELAEIFMEKGLQVDVSKLYKDMYRFSDKSILAPNQLEWLSRHHVDIHADNFLTTRQAAKLDLPDSLRYLENNGGGKPEIRSMALDTALAEGAYDSAFYLVSTGVKMSPKQQDALFSEKTPASVVRKFLPYLNQNGARASGPSLHCS